MGFRVWVFVPGCMGMNLPSIYLIPYSQNINPQSYYPKLKSLIVGVLS